MFVDKVITMRASGYVSNGRALRALNNDRLISAPLEQPQPRGGKSRRLFATWYRYQDVLTYPGSKPLLLLAFLARMANIPFTTLVTAVVFEITDSWLWAGIGGGLTAASAVGPSWWFGVLIDNHGVRRVLSWTWPGGLLVLSVGAFSAPSLVVVCCLIAGILRPPVGTTVRSAWNSLLSNEQERAAAYALDSTLMPMAGAAGALAGGAAMVVFGIWGALVMMAFLTALSAIGMIFNKATCSVQATGKSDPHYDRQPLGARVWLAIIASGLSWSALTSAELAVGSAWGASTMVFASGLSLISVGIGAGAYVVKSEQVTSLTAVAHGLMLLAGSLIALSLVVYWSPYTAVLALASLGLGRGLIASASMQAISIQAPKERMSEAMGLYGAGTMVGSASYRPVAAVLMAWSPVAMVLLPAVAAVALALKSRSESEISRSTVDRSA